MASKIGPSTAQRETFSGQCHQCCCRVCSVVRRAGVVVTAGCHHSKMEGRQQDRRTKKKGAMNKEGEPGGGRRARARERVRWEMERKKKGKRLITERCKVTPWLIDLDQLPATWIKLASYSQQTFLLLSKLKYVMYALVITVPNLGINTLFHYEFTWLSQNLTEFNQIYFWRCRSDQNIVWYGILHAILIFSSLLDWNLKEEEYFLLTFHKLLDSSLLKLLLCINFTS